jgi:hypothetical protein
MGRSKQRPYLRPFDSLGLVEKQIPRFARDDTRVIFYSHSKPCLSVSRYDRRCRLARFCGAALVFWLGVVREFVVVGDVDAEAAC